jgi:hypothetical protein
MKEKIKIINKWSLICANASIDMASNQLSLFNVIDEVTITPSTQPLPKLPQDGIIAALNHEFVSLWSRDLKNIEDPLKIAAKFKFLDPENTLIQEQDIEIVFDVKKENVRLIIKLNAIKVKIPGVYKYQIEITDKNMEPLMINTPFRIKIDKIK